MSVSGYLSEHWGLLVLLIGMALVLHSDTHLEHQMIRKIALTDILLLLYSVSCYAESYYSDQRFYSIMRAILSAVNYSLITFILVSIITVMYPMQKAFLLIPAMINAVLCFISVPTKIVFYFTSDNHFKRGTLGYLTYFIDALYLAYLIYNLFRNSRIRREDFKLVLFISASSVACLVSPLFMEDSTTHWFNITIAIDILIYYVFLLQQFTKRDPLTKLLNRQSYYSFAEKYMESITAVVTMDINGLKKINDTEGHIAGDKAIKTLADCFWNAAEFSQRVYRIGGDEFVILCTENSEEEVISLTRRIKEEVEKTPYRCSVGYAIRQDDADISIDELYRLADKMLYEDKKKYYDVSNANINTQ